MVLNENKSCPRKLSYQKIYQYALEIFGYDKDKCNVWWMSKNKLLEDLSPFEFVREGKGRELMKMMNRCIS